MTEGPDKKMSLLNRLFLRSYPLEALAAKIGQLQSTLTRIQEALGRIEGRQTRSAGGQGLQENEFRVFSQWGEDGIIQYLIHHVEVERKLFVEFGVENYAEANTRFLLVNNHWAGLVVDSNPDHIAYIKNDPIYWQHNLKAVQAFITRENVNEMITQRGIRGGIGLLSIDIDGNDYWVWEAMQAITPAIVIVEYNSRFGKDRAVTIPYREDFLRSSAHPSMIYYGASLKALCLLGKRKGYAFVGCNSAGNNAFFVLRSLKPDLLRELTVEEGYVAGQFRESRNRDGRLAYLSPEEEAEILASLPLVDVEER